MENTYLENNRVTLAGIVDGELSFSHMIYGEKFYLFKLRVPRLSEHYDFINVTISERFFPDIHPMPGDSVLVHGQFRSYNNFTTVGSRLILTVFAKDVSYMETIQGFPNPNQIYLNGYICKPPVYRMTPFEREIADILLAVNRSYNKSDYLPCIAWGRNAKYAQTLPVGTNLRIWGRIQSRMYQKRIGENEVETKTAYEISVSKMEVGMDDERDYESEFGYSTQSSYPMQNNSEYEVQDHDAQLESDSPMEADHQDWIEEDY